MSVANPNQLNVRKILMFDDRTNRRSPKIEALKIWPYAECGKCLDLGYVVTSNEVGQPRYIGIGRSAWSAWMDAEVAERKPS